MRREARGNRRRAVVIVFVIVARLAAGTGFAFAQILKSVEAVGMTVANMDRSIEFFNKVLSFEKVGDMEVHGREYEKLQGVFGLRMRVVRMQLGREIIELTQYLAPEGRPIPADWRSNDRWFQHIAIVVSDMDKAYEHLRRHKVRHASTGPQTIPASNKAAAGIRAFYFKDPDGHNLEIIYIPPGKGDPRWQRGSGRLFVGIDHTAIVVAGTVNSLKYYRDLLGLKVVGESMNHGIEQERLNNVSGARLRITGLRAERGPGIEFLEYLEAILTGYSHGTRYGIRMDHDGLLIAGTPGVQLTWMDAKVGEWVVTPRIGKPVEIQALWLNALWIGSQFNEWWKEPLARGRESFGRCFWQEQGGYLNDVVDADHVPGNIDASFRPNQIFAVGGLPLQIIDGEPAERIVDAVERRLWTPLGLRSLAPEEPGYIPLYRGGVRKRDGAYHQGTVWPWLIGPFLEAWVRVRGNTGQTRREARTRYLAPLIEHLEHAGLGHISEIADAEPPHKARGCPFQAWSLAELIRLDRVVLA